MRTETLINDLNGAGSIAAAHSQASAIDATNGMSVKLDQRSIRGLVVTVRNSGEEPGQVAVVTFVHYPGPTGTTGSVSVNVPAGETVLISNFDVGTTANFGRVDFDFSPGFVGELAAFRLPRSRMSYGNF